MLGNQYFLARKFRDAIPHLEAALSAEQGSKAIRKKLIICYIDSGLTEKAVQTFSSFLDDDIGVIAGTNIIAEDCPCLELISEIHKNYASSPTPDMEELKMMLGILWLYCSPERSAKIFTELDGSRKYGELSRKAVTAINEYYATIQTTLSNQGVNLYAQT